MTTAALQWLSAQHFADVCYVLMIDGTGYAFITRPELGELRAAWGAATEGVWAMGIYGGLVIQGSIERHIEMFDPTIDPGQLRFSILDYNEVIGPLMFGEGNPDILRTPITFRVAPIDTSIQVADVEALDLDEIAFLGLETIHIVGLNDEDSWTVERGLWSIFPNEGGPTWIRTHEVDPNGDAPEVTSRPTVWDNRFVGLYVCHRVGETWSAGFPGTVPNDAHLLWAGVIKHWSEGGGWIHLDCEEVPTLLKTTVGARIYEGTLDEGIYLEEGDAEIQIRARLLQVEVVGPDNLITNQWGDQVYVAQLSTIAGTITSHAEAATAINAALADALTGANDGLYAPEGMTGELTLDAEPTLGGEQRYHLVFTWDDAPVGAVDGVVEVWLSPFVWGLLGFHRDRGPAKPADVADGRIARVDAQRLTGTSTVWRVAASEMPRRFMIRFDAMDSAGQHLTVVPSTNIPFTPQTVMPTGFGTAELFLGLGDEKVVAVEHISGHVFSVRGIVDARFRRGRTNGGNVVSGENELSEFLWAYDDGGPPIKVRQVWIQPFTTAGEGLATLLLSTGETNYNDATYDKLPLGFGVAFPSSLVDVDSFIDELDLEDYILVIEKPKPAAQLFEAVLGAMGKNVTWSAGRLTVVNPLAEPTAGLLELDETNEAALHGEEFEPMTVERNPSTVINRATLRHSQRLDGSFAYAETYHARRSQSERGQVRSIVIDGYGLFQSAADYWMENVVPAILLYYSRPVAAAQRSCNFNVAVQLAPGMQAVLGHPTMINPRTGRRGVEGLVVWVPSVTWDPMTGLGELGVVFAPHALRELPE